MATDDGKELVAKGEITEPSLSSQAGMDVAKVMENRKGANFYATLNTNLRITRDTGVARSYCKRKRHSVVIKLSSKLKFYVSVVSYVVSIYYRAMLETCDE